MRVGLVTTSFPLSTNPVSGVFVARLAEELAKRVDVTVLTPAGTETAASTQTSFPVRYFRYAPQNLQKLAHQPGGVPVALRTSPASVLFLPLFIVALFIATLRLSRRCDVIHANWSACGAIAGLAGLLTRRPVITTLRGSDVMRLDRSKPARWLLAVTLWTNKQVVCVSSDIENQIRRLFPRMGERVRTIPNGVDDQFLSLSHLGHNRPELHLVAVGSLIPRKALDVAISAVARLQNSKIYLIVVGDGPERPRLEALIEEHALGDQVRLLGAQPPHAIPGFLENADALVLTSRHEGRPNVVIEAMAAGLPVVATAIPGVRELVPDGEVGLLFEPGDIAGLAAHLGRLLEEPDLRRELGQAGRRRVLGLGLSWDRAASAYCDLYQAAVGHR